MRSLVREKRTVWASLYSSREKVLDSRGRFTGQWVVAHSDPVELRATLSPASGALESYGFGTGGDYDRTMVIDKTGTGLDEHSVLWVDETPEFDDEGHLKLTDDGAPTVPWDYTVARPVAESYNYTNVALKRADR